MAAAKAKADAWRAEREASRVAQEAARAAKEEEQKKLLKAASEHKKAHAEASKSRQEEEAKTKAAAIAALVAQMKEDVLSVPEAKEGAFTYAQLKELASPEQMRDAGIHTHTREKYLSAAEFQTVFGLSRADFAALPAWKRDKAKKEASLF